MSPPTSTRLLLPLLALLVSIAGACSGLGSEYDKIELQNSAGKQDGATLRVRLTEASPIVTLAVRCDQQPGCGGWLLADVVAPPPCDLLGGDFVCGIGGMDPTLVDVATMRIDSYGTGRQELPVSVSTEDGRQFRTWTTADFQAEAFEEVLFVVEKAEDAPDLTIDLQADWWPEHGGGGAPDAGPGPGPIDGGPRPPDAAPGPTPIDAGTGLPDAV